MKLLGLGIAVQIVADAVVGVRLLLLARRTRRLPELCLGLCCLLLGGIGLPLSLVARGGLAASRPELAGQLLAVGFAFQNAACLALFVATWRIFRPDAGWAAGLSWAAGLAMLASLVGQAATVGFRGGVDQGAFYQLGFVARALAFAWGGFEAGHYALLLRRRIRLGLADPVVADRFRLWALCCLAVVFGFASFAASRALGVEPATSPVVLSVTSVVGSVAGVALWLAFLPPRAYLRRVAARA